MAKKKSKRDPRLIYAKEDDGQISIGAPFRLVKGKQSIAVAMFKMCFPAGPYPEVKNVDQLIVALAKHGESLAKSFKAKVVLITKKEYDAEHND